jgi:hypothetical protein
MYAIALSLKHFIYRFIYKFYIRCVLKIINLRLNLINI